MKNKISNKLKNLTENISLNQIIIILTVINALTQIILGRIHNNAAYKVFSTVSIFSFFFVIFLLIDVVNSFREDRGLFALITALIIKIISIGLSAVYITRLTNDENYIKAMLGELNNSEEVAYAIQDSVSLIYVGIILLVITSILLTIDYIKNDEK